MDGENQHQVVTFSGKSKGLFKKHQINSRRRFSNRRLVTIVLILALVTICSVVGYKLYQRQVEINKFYSEASAIISTSDHYQLQKMVDKITQKKGYEKNPNYVYTVIQYHIKTGNLEAATKYYDILKNEHGSGFKLAKEFKNNSRTLEEVRLQLESLKGIQNSYQKSRSFF